MHRHFWALLLTVSLTSCRTEAPLDPAPAPTDGANKLSLSLAKQVYQWDELAFGGEGVVAVVRNLTTTDYYARVGDAFDSAFDQPMIKIANNTDAALQLSEGAAWIRLASGTLIEGSRAVRLRAGGTYTLVGHLEPPRRVGTMRVRLAYATRVSDLADSTALSVDYSPQFTVR